MKLLPIVLSLGTGVHVSHGLVEVVADRIEFEQQPGIARIRRDGHWTMTGDQLPHVFGRSHARSRGIVTELLLLGHRQERADFFGSQFGRRLAGTAQTLWSVGLAREVRLHT